MKKFSCFGNTIALCCEILVVLWGFSSVQDAHAAKNRRVLNARPIASISAPQKTKVGKVMTLRGLASDYNPADRAAGFTYIWHFGDGNKQSGVGLRKPKHTYTRAGNFKVTLTVRDRNGARSRRATTRVKVRRGPSGATPAPTSVPGSTPPPGSTPTPTAAPTNPPGTALRTVNPQEISDQIISNPGMGWQSCDKVNTSGQDAQGFKNKVAYIKYYWRNIETADNVYNWSTFDQRISQARSSGQKVAFRIVAVDNLTAAPAWLQSLGVPGFSFVAEGGPTVWTPDFNNATALQKHAEFIRTLGERYNGHPDIDHIDIGTVGLWGEWHFGDTSPAVPMPSQASLNKIIDHYFDYFPNTPKVAQLEHQNSLTYAIQRGAGFRGDCWGNIQWQNRSSPPGMYAQRIAGASAQNAWRTAPVAMETCWTMSYWANQNWNVDYILQWAVDNHVSQVHNKNSAVPASMVPKVNEMLKKLGYRYVLKQLRHPVSSQAGRSIVLSMDWDNKGNSPSYSNYRLGVQIRNSSGAVVATIVTATEVKNWMPGAFAVDQSINLPANLAAGQYTIALSVVDPSSGEPKVQLANTGKESGGWYPFSTIQIQ